MPSWLDKYVYSPKKKSTKKRKSVTKKGSQGNKQATPVNKETDVWICGQCGEEFEDENDLLVECYLCERHYCAECIELKEGGYETLSRLDVFWFCPGCHPKAKSCWDQNKDTDRRFEELTNSIGKRRKPTRKP